MARRLIVLPDDSGEPIRSAIAGARRTLRIKMFVFSDPVLLDAIIAAKRRGVSVRVMLNPARRSGERDNRTARRTLERARVDVKDTDPAFTLTHEKSMVVDDDTAFVQSLNWTTRNLTATRDYAIVTKHRHDVADITDCFEADWQRLAFDPRRAGDLVWCPGPGRERICGFIDSARHTLFVENERYQDMVVIEHLVRAARRGVKVHVLARPPRTLKAEKLVEAVGGLRILEDVGIKIHELKHLRLHGKLLLADTTAAIVGSINFAPGSFDGRRELAIEVRGRVVVNRLHRVARHDWEHSHALDLSDAGLRAELSDSVEGTAERLAIDRKGVRGRRRRTTRPFQVDRQVSH